MLPFPNDEQLEPLPSRRPSAEAEDESAPPETLPMPRTSEVRIRVSRLHEIVDLVTADLQLDPRSEEFIGGPELVPSPSRRFCVAPAPLRSRPAGARVATEVAAMSASDERATIRVGSRPLDRGDRELDLPLVSAPVVSAPVVSAPVVSAPVVSAPVVSAPVVSAPVPKASRKVRARGTRPTRAKKSA